MKQKKKFFNLRLFFIGFVGMIFGILNFYNLFKMIWLNKFNFWFVIFTIIFISSVILIFVFSFYKNYRKYLKYVIVFCLLFAISGSMFSIKINEYKNYKDYGDNCTIEGIVSSYYYKKNYYQITIKDAAVNGEKVKSKITLYVNLTEPISEDISLGDKITTTGDINFKPLVTDKININKYVNNSVYSTNIVASEINLTNLKPNVIYFLQERLRDTLNKGLTNENSDIAYGVLVGDKTELDQSVTDTFSYAGISHILAVSGLHVGFLVAIITFLLNLFRIGRRKRFFITSIILIFYSIFCNMTPSILRASFMSIILLLAGVLGEEYDGLNSLGFSGILILLLFPQELFSIGFQLSFMCVFMIITLADKLTRILKSWKIPESIASAISISFCVTLGSSIILANTLYRVSIISIVTNIIVIPLFSITYPLLFLLALIGMIIPAFSGLLFLPQILLHLIKLIANLFAGINFAHFRVFNLGYVLMFLFAILSIVVKFFMASKTIKLPVCIILSVACVVITIGGIQPKNYKTFTIYTNYQYNSSSTLLTTESGKKYLVGIDDYFTLNYLTELKINKLDAIILQDFEINKLNNYIDLLKEIKVLKLVVPTNVRYNDEIFKELKEYTEIICKNNWREDIEIKFLREDDLICGTLVEINNKTILFPNGITKEKLNILGNKLNNVNYVIVNTSKYDFKDYGIDYEMIIHSKDLKFETNSAISLKNKSNYVIQL